MAGFATSASVAVLRIGDTLLTLFFDGSNDGQESVEGQKVGAVQSGDWKRVLRQHFDQVFEARDDDRS